MKFFNLKEKGNYIVGYRFTVDDNTYDYYNVGAAQGYWGVPNVKQSLLVYNVDNMWKTTEQIRKGFDNHFLQVSDSAYCNLLLAYFASRNFGKGASVVITNPWGELGLSKNQSVTVVDYNFENGQLIVMDAKGEEYMIGLRCIKMVETF